MQKPNTTTTQDIPQLTLSKSKGKAYIGVTVSFLCHDGQGNYVFSLRGQNCRDEQGRWDTGGGALEFGSTPEETLRKEVKEEYGADVQEFEFLGFRDIHRVQDGVPTHWISLDYRARVNHDEVKNGEPHKFDRVEWFSLDNLPSPLHSQEAVALQKYKDQLT